MLYYCEESLCLRKCNLISSSLSQLLALEIRKILWAFIMILSTVISLMSIEYYSLNWNQLINYTLYESLTKRIKFKSMQGKI